MIPVIDMHCDTMSILHDRQRNGTTIHLANNDLHIDLQKMQNSGYLCQNFALFTYLGTWQENANNYQGGGGAGAAFPGPKEYALSLIGIPYRTVQDWEAEKRELPDYLLRLLKYRAEIERMVKKNET